MYRKIKRRRPFVNTSLMPCPFCGCKRVVVCITTNLLTGKDVFYVSCMECGSETAGRSRKSFVIKLWQKRVTHKDNENRF